MNTNEMWHTAKVFTKAPGFGVDKEIQERRIITIKPGETTNEALEREGFNPAESRAKIINF